MEDCMVKEEISKDILINRLKKIEWQARGIQKRKKAVDILAS
jgi:DNA-binding FrmR family transcriptional regulator